MTKKLVLNFLSVMICTFGLSAFADDTAPTPVPAPATPIPAPATPAPAPAAVDDTVLGKLHVIDTTEISAGNLAIAKACNADVKSFAQMLIDDHTKNDASVMQFAQTKGITLTLSPDDAKFSKLQKDTLQAEQDAITKLGAITDCSFDREFLTTVKDGHAFAYRVARRALWSNKDQDLTVFLAMTKDQIRAHYEMAKDLLKYIPADQPAQ